MPRDENKHVNRDQQSLFVIWHEGGGAPLLHVVCTGCEPEISILKVDPAADPLTLRQITDAAHNHLRERGW